jgi:F0F1-type ATP synthase delta subunit
VQENDVSRLVRKPGISIRNSLKGIAADEPAEEAPSPDQEVQEQRESETEARSDPDSILQAWNDYAASKEKKMPRIYSTLANNKPSISDKGVVLVRLNSEAQRDNFIKNIKSELVNYIKEATGLQEVEILAEVSAKAGNGKKIYTDQDKLEFLVQKNPELAKLRSRFNLDFDN